MKIYCVVRENKCPNLAELNLRETGVEGSVIELKGLEEEVFLSEQDAIDRKSIMKNYGKENDYPYWDNLIVVEVEVTAKIVRKDI